MKDEINLTISKEDTENYKRLDHYLTEKLPDYSRSFIKSLFKAGSITLVNHDNSPKKLELKKMPTHGTEISIAIPEPVPSEALAEDIPLEIIYEDEHLVVINKQAGLVSHPAPGNYTGTLVNAALFHCKDLQAIGSKIRPGIVHRLDKGTTGLMVIAKSQKAYEGLVLLFSKHEIDRYYEAIVVNKSFPLSGKLESTIGRHPQNRLKMAPNVRGGRHAITFFHRLKTYGPFHHIELKLETGRTHQIRVHLTKLQKSPILFDPLYGNPAQDLLRLNKFLDPVEIEEYPYPILHAKTLGFLHPITGKHLKFTQNPPPFFQNLLEQLKKTEASSETASS